MAQKEYKFNPQTLTYEVITAPFRIRFYRMLRKLLIGLILVSISNFLFSFFFYTPKMYRIQRNNRELVLKYGILEDKISAATRKIEEIRHRDQMVYRALFAADTLSIPGIYTDYPDSKYAVMAQDRYAGIMVGTWKNLDALTRLMYLESKSMDDLQALSADKEKMATAIPAIWPIDRNGLRGRIGAFGGRNHPTLGRFQMHTGVDLGGRIGAPVYATGDGRVVIEAENRGTGYGIQVLIDHGFGYKTRYAHLNKALVVLGQRVRRGEVIGELGNTGRSTGPHLHYEVIYRGQHVNPVNYFRRDMSDDDFREIIDNAAATTFENGDGTSPDNNETRQAE
ncbi:MAG: M23 family metallopeptidase [Rikenellaceae bacterium]|jgi:murein DD-endopeptidase MepM/ murein hydrolase activator NlpD|nr:M23 family metallopeptidase [Rikenellaceae bacterium]